MSRNKTIDVMYSATNDQVLEHQSNIKRKSIGCPASFILTYMKWVPSLLPPFVLPIKTDFIPGNRLHIHSVMFVASALPRRWNLFLLYKWSSGKQKSFSLSHYH